MPPEGLLSVVLVALAGMIGTVTPPGGLMTVVLVVMSWPCWNDRDCYAPWRSKDCCSYSSELALLE